MRRTVRPPRLASWLAAAGAGCCWWGWPGRLLAVRSAALRVFEEGEEVVGWPVAAAWRVGRGGLCECPFFDSDVGVEVCLGGSQVFVSEPERDDGDVDSGCEELHGRCVSEDVRGDLLRFECGAVLGGGHGVSLETTGNGVSGEATAGAGAKQRVGVGSLSFLEPYA